MAWVVPSLALPMALNGQWFQDQLVFRARECVAGSCTGTYIHGVARPPELTAATLVLLAVAVAGAVAAVLVTTALVQSGRLRSAATATILGVAVVTLAGSWGVAQSAGARRG